VGEKIELDSNEWKCRPLAEKEGGVDNSRLERKGRWWWGVPRLVKEVKTSLIAHEKTLEGVSDSSLSQAVPVFPPAFTLFGPLCSISRYARLEKTFARRESHSGERM